MRNRQLTRLPLVGGEHYYTCEDAHIMIHEDFSNLRTYIALGIIFSTSKYALSLGEM
jgi:hypothetical protein